MLSFSLFTKNRGSDLGVLPNATQLGNGAPDTNSCFSCSSLMISKDLLTFEHANSFDLLLTLRGIPDISQSVPNASEGHIGPSLTCYTNPERTLISFIFFSN